MAEETKAVEERKQDAVVSYEDGVRIVDLDVLEPQWKIRFRGKEHQVEPLGLEHYTHTVEAFRKMQGVDDLTEDQVKRLQGFLLGYVPTLTDEDFSHMSPKQMFRLVREITDAQVLTPEELVELDRIKAESGKSVPFGAAATEKEEEESSD